MHNGCLDTCVHSERSIRRLYYLGCTMKSKKLGRRTIHVDEV